jgi:eukaryotic-like serine/threonine-protein kinase
VGSCDNKLYALNASTGTKKWSYTTGGEIQSSPAVVNGLVYVGSFDQKLYALNASNGTKKWSYTTGGLVASSPAVANGVVYVGSSNGDLAIVGSLYALDARTGAFLWSATIPGNISSPAVANGLVYVGSDVASLYAYSLDPGGVYRTIIPRPDPAELIPDLRLQPQFGKGTIESSEEVE